MSKQYHIRWRKCQKYFYVTHWQKNSWHFWLLDNETLVLVINKLISQVGQVMRMVRHLVLRCLQYNILIKAKHISGKKNILTDCLSRFQVEQFFKLAPKAQNKPRSIPEIYLPKNFWKTLKWDTYKRAWNTFEIFAMKYYQ